MIRGSVILCFLFLTQKKIPLKSKEYKGKNKAGKVLCPYKQGVKKTINTVDMNENRYDICIA